MDTQKPYSYFRTCYRMSLLVLWCIIAPLYYFTAELFGYKQLNNIPMLFHQICCRILSIKPEIHGQLCSHRPTLYISNHVSYLDVFVLGGIVPGCFIAKSEVASWPVLGRLARIQNTLFFQRNGSKVHGQLGLMQEHLSKGGNLILFPEGTSTEGEHVEPFKSSLFHAAEKTTDVLIQPITLAYTKHRGTGMSRTVRDHYAWYATMPFGSHFLKMAGMHSAQVELIFLPPVKLQDFDSRKACAEHCYQQVAKALGQSLTGTNHEETDYATLANHNQANSLD